MTPTRLSPIHLRQIRFDDGFWKARIDTNRTVTLPIEYEQLTKTGRIDAWRLDWREGMPNKPHRFWDSDVAKWIEAAAYSLTTHADPDLEAQVDAVIVLIEKAQQSDGYLNIFYTAVEPENRWKNLRDWHELYCAGHLMEAAVAYFDATGKDSLLRVMCRYADYIDNVFGPSPGQKRGYPGHQEIELALVKLHRITGEEKYLHLAKFFIDERGQQPCYYDIEAKARGEDPADFWAKTYEYNQAHLPVRLQTEAVGHAVRACYLYAGMTDIAAATDDELLQKACKTLWRNLTEKRMYITGGIGSTRLNEGFTTDYDLPNETTYAETCAAIALVFWAQRMAHLEPNSQYIDVMERALYNGVMSGLSLDGQKFFYANPLATHPNVNPYPSNPLQDGNYGRSEWFGCACCPPNIARLIASLGQYVYSAGEDEIVAHLYAASQTDFDIGGQRVTLQQRTNYPWDETVTIGIASDAPCNFTLSLRIPGWCDEASLAVNGKSVAMGNLAGRGYAKINRRWQPGDEITLRLSMPVRRVAANSAVRQTAGRIALQRGPIVYCLEEIDNGKNLANVVVPSTGELAVKFEPSLLGGVSVVTGPAMRPAATEALYFPAESQSMEEFEFTAIPYFAWANRQLGEMRVWLLAK